VSVAELLSVELAQNRNRGGNMQKCRFYVCPSAATALISTGEGCFPAAGESAAAGGEAATRSTKFRFSQGEKRKLRAYGARDVTRRIPTRFSAQLHSGRRDAKKLYPDKRGGALFR
jgi:hypothetical protein